MDIKNVAALSFRIVVPSMQWPCGCRPTFEYCANDYQTYHSICEYKCLNPTIQFQDWFILYFEPCYYDPTTPTTTTTTARTTTAVRGPCGCISDYTFCGDDYRTYHSACEYKCKHPSSKFEKWTVMYDGACVTRL
ncbi:uncharacterized protein LOC125242418 isoform X2 [Leguminivora glycinivorella]|uniref:uncharacterized protein LOC125242418 isoform X2 n=1 Tax=Leguminivora glycinivorella TaxID=1035111 RepID=UPI0020103BDF|nr:uncharacterized protein LOC125242418 isoform X2 [Leguminivora glycinivorella]